MKNGSTSREKLIEHWDDRLAQASVDYLRETFGWSSLGGSQRKSTLPYHDSRSLTQVREVGRTIATKPTGVSATSKLISFAVGRGHTYTITPRLAAESNKRKLDSQKRFAAQSQMLLDFEQERLDWASHQIETYERIIRDGEAFRVKWRTPAGIDITYIEPEDVDQPGSRRECNLDTVPDFIMDLFDGDKPPGVLGIISAAGDVRRVLGYWVKDGNTYDFFPSQSVQHIKDGVDKNDPRGVPRFYWAFCHIMGIDAIDAGMRDLFLVQAKHAAVYNYEQSSLIADLKRMATQESRDQEELYGGRPAPPGTVHAKGFTVDLPGMHVAAKDAVEIIQQEQRLVGGCSDIPEHLISEDANTGNRSSLVAAEGPFDRRIQREQLMLWPWDRDILWLILASDADIGIEDLQAVQLEYKITPHFPAAQSRDRDKEIESDMLLVDRKIKSIRQCREGFRIDHDQAEQDLKSQAPMPLEVNNTVEGSSAGNPP